MGEHLRQHGMGYLLAVVATAAVALVRYSLSGLLGEVAPFLPFVLAVIVPAWYGGLKPGLLATGLGAVTAVYLFTPPHFSLRIEAEGEWAGLAVFLVIGVTTSWLCEALHAARRRSEAKQRELDVDVAARRQVEGELREREQRLQALFDQATVGIARCDLTGRFVEVNRRFCEIVARSPEELYRLRAQDITHPDDLARSASRMEEGPPYVVEKRYVRPDGSHVWVSKSMCVVRDGDGKPMYLVAVVFDITERKKAEEHVHRLLAAEKQQSLRLREVAQAARTINACHSLESVLRVITEEARRIVGTHQAVSSMTVNEQWAQAVNTVSFTDKYAAWRTYDAKPDGTGIYALVCRDNRPMRLTQAELAAHPAFLGFGKEAGKHPPLRGWLAVPFVKRDGRNMGLLQVSDKVDGGDFTEEDEAILVQLALIASVAIENARLYEEQREGDRRKDEFLATLAHELRNPLAPLRNGLQVMRLSGDGEGEASVRDMMERQVQQLVRLVDDLLDVSRISRGKLELRKERVELAKVIQNAVEIARPLIEAAGHELTVTLPPQPVFVDGDPVRLAQVFSNLLNNAAKYSDREGRIWVTAERQGSDAVVTVKDTGVGIPADMLPRIFEMFTQVDRSLERSQGGLGLGLNIVRRLVQLHGGSVEVHSEGHGMGSEFVVRLPVATVHTTQAQPPCGECHGTPAGPCKVLVVDDNVDSATSLGMILRLMGHDSRTAHDGLQAVGVAESYRPDVVLLDIGLPKLNGYDVARRIREQPWGKEMKLVALTGWGQDDDKRQAKEAGFDHHMVKPVDPAALEKLLGKFCPTPDEVRA